MDVYVGTLTGSCLLHQDIRVPVAGEPPSAPPLKAPALCQFLACVHTFTAAPTASFVTLPTHVVAYIATHTFLFSVACQDVLPREGLAKVRVTAPGWGAFWSAVPCVCARAMAIFLPESIWQG